MQIGIIGLGRMGANMARRLARGGVKVVAFDPGDAARAALAEENGVATVAGLAELCARLDEGERVILMMIPAGEAIDATFKNGVLKLRIPKHAARASSRHRIEIHRG